MIVVAYAVVHPWTMMVQVDDTVSAVATMMHVWRHQRLASVALFADYGINCSVTACGYAQVDA